MRWCAGTRHGRSAASARNAAIERLRAALQMEPDESVRSEIRAALDDAGTTHDACALQRV